MTRPSIRVLKQTSLLAGASIALAAILAVIYLGAGQETFVPTDFGHYRTATHMFLSGQNPYGTVELFGPPWFALLFAPFALLPMSMAAILWLSLNVISVAGFVTTAFKIIRPGLSGHALSTLNLCAVLITPASLCSYVMGQVSPIIGVSIAQFRTVLFLVSCLCHTAAFMTISC